MNSNLLQILVFAIIINKNLTILKKIILITFLFIFLSLCFGISLIKFPKQISYNKSCIEKTFIINLNIENKNIQYLLDSVRNYLKTINWEELTKYDAKKDELIGFSICGNKKNISLKSQINYGIYTQQDSIFTNKIYFKEHFKDEKYFENVTVLQKEDYLGNPINLLNFINVNIKNKKLRNKSYFILKGLDYSNGKQLLIFNKDDNSKQNLNKINDFLISMNNNLFLLDEFVESIKFKVDETNLNQQKINSESEYGRRSMIRFFIITILKDDKLYVLKYNKYTFHLNVLPTFGSISKDLENPGSFISNYFNGKNLDDKYYKKLNDSKKLNIDTYRNISYDDNERKYPNEFLSNLFCIGNEDVEKVYPNKIKLIHNKIDEFINVFSKIYHNQITCKNSKCFNKHFVSCFNIFAVDSIFTEDDEFKVLDINSNLSRINLRLFKKNTNIFNIYELISDIFTFIKDNNEGNSLSLIYNEDKRYPKKLYFLSEQQSSMYPEMVRTLNKRNLLRSIWRNPLNNNKDIELYLGFVVKSEMTDNNKDMYLNYLTFFLGDYSITNKLTGAIYDLGDKTDLYNMLKGDIMIPEYVEFKISRGKNTDNYITTQKLLEIENFILGNQSTCSRFILKPSLGSQGDGINVIKYNEQFIEWYKKENKYEEWTISEFLNPKLFQNKKLNDNLKRKAHIRSYFILVRDRYNKLDIYELRNRLLYFAVDKYDDSCVIMNDQNKYSFITNLALASEERNIYYNTDNYTDLLENYENQIFNFKRLSSKITEYGLRCLEKVGNNNLKCFNKHNKNFVGCYQILAIDYLPINKNDIKLLEVNKGPGFKGLKSNLNLENIFDEIFNVTIDKLNGISQNKLFYLNKIN